ncbi:hypothetical protein L207DRAFT_581518 [Hyaloscypha variabilis F]|uniref:NACHT domain-containing protein n=1 Tax=Hyaloscypha variabilis (strain UAMH 11265 / GT02V1 / F) TaxID=1149755 RepID=A0A2J6RWJ0_HYAVF|nr:hypothetical protein L207DRAFT_581518 [Hyaloscypha variabilis F]
MSLPDNSDSQTPVGNPLFEEIHEKFLQTLPDRERSLFSKCASAKDLLAEARNWKTIKKNKFQGLYLMENIKRFSDCLQPYFDAVGIIFSSNSEYAAIAWGAIRLALQLANNFSTFFEKLTTTLRRLSEQLPGYDDVLKILKNSPSSRLKASMQKVYLDLFHFLTSVIGIFTKKDGTSKSSAAIMIKLLWKPFDAFFETTLEELRFHADLVRDEIIIEQLNTSTCHNRMGLEEQARAAQDRIASAEARELTKHNEFLTSESMRLQEKRNEDESFIRVKKWISPPEFMVEFEKAQDKRHEGTAEWLFEEPLFNIWAETELSAPSCTDKYNLGANTLWIRGNPGCGKTVLAAAAVGVLRCQQSFNQNSRAAVYHFFFRSGFPTLSDRISAYRAILAQILQRHKRDHELVDKFSFIMNNDSEGQLTASPHQIHDLLQICLQCLGNCVLIFDGVDECYDQLDLTADLICYSTMSDVKLLIFSRPTASALAAAIPTQQQLNIARSTSHDITLYLTRSLQILQNQRLLPEESKVGQLAEQLTTAADGMFLWGHLMIKYLNTRSFQAWQRLLAN